MVCKEFDYNMNSTGDDVKYKNCNSSDHGVSHEFNINILSLAYTWLFLVCYFSQMYLENLTTEN